MDVGLPGTLLLPILRYIRKSVQELRDVLSSTDLRLIGSSLLIVYEGDWERAELGTEWLDNDEERKEEEMEEGSGEDGEGSEDGDSEDWDSLCPCAVRLIDFAHTRLRPGQGPEPACSRDSRCCWACWTVG